MSEEKEKNREFIFESSRRKVIFPENNEYIAVCQQGKQVPKTIKGEDGLTYKAESWKWDGKLYIDGIFVREYGGEYRESEDSPFDGGMSVEFAEQMAKELLIAVNYCKKNKL